MPALRLLALLVACYAIGRSTPTSAQNWADAGLPGLINDWGDFYVDPVTNKLYATGKVNQVYPGGPAGVYVRNGAQWDTLGLFWGGPRTLIRYNDTLLLAGYLPSMVGGGPISHVAFLDSSGWHPYGTFSGGVAMLRILDGELYAVGGFSTVDGQPSVGLAKRVGAQWVPISGLVPTGGPALYDVIKYQGNLVVCGNMSVQGIQGLDVYVLQNGQWSALGGGLSGMASGGWEMTIYNDELILGGNFFLSAGNAGHSIMRWNGNVWQPLGAGVTDPNNSYNASLQVYALNVRDGKLFVGGGFFFAGGVPARGIATWDGDQWCGLGSDLQLVHDIEFYNDTLYAMVLNHWVDGIYNSGGVYYRHETYDDTCSVPLGTGLELLPPASHATLAQGDDQAYVLGLTDGVHPYAIMDASGRIVDRGSLVSLGKRSTNVHLDALVPGLYIMAIPGVTNIKFNSRRSP